MGRKPEDDIQKKLVELEISIKDEQEKAKVPAASQKSTNLIPESSDDPKAVAEAKTNIDMCHYGGIGLLGVGGIMLLSHLQIATVSLMWFGVPAIGVMVVPLMVGLGMLIYNYKSRMAQMLTVGTLVAIVLMVLMRMTIYFPTLSVLDFVILSLPVCAGGALLAKAQMKRRELKETIKLIK